MSPKYNRFYQFAFSACALDRRNTGLPGKCRRGTRLVLGIGLMNQTTIEKPIKISGVGLHTGVKVDLELKPAPENTGYIFVRTDLDNFEIPASVEYISHCSYATTLMRRGVVLDRKSVV